MELYCLTQFCRIMAFCMYTLVMTPKSILRKRGFPANEGNNSNNKYG